MHAAEWVCLLPCPCRAATVLYRAREYLLAIRIQLCYSYSYALATKQTSFCSAPVRWGGAFWGAQPRRVAGSVSSMSSDHAVMSCALCFCLVNVYFRQPVLPTSKLEQSRAAGLNSIQHRYDSASTAPRRYIAPLFHKIINTFINDRPVIIVG